LAVLFAGRPGSGDGAFLSAGSGAFLLRTIGTRGVEQGARLRLLIAFSMNGVLVPPKNLYMLIADTETNEAPNQRKKATLQSRKPKAAGTD
jgi:hypothetical protein